MERAGFQCEECGAEDKTLNVHHSYYEKGLDPWEYDARTLHCLCEDCHSIYGDTRAQLNKWIGFVPLSLLDFVLGYTVGLGYKCGDVDEIPFAIGSLEHASGICDCVGIPVTTLMDRAPAANGLRWISASLLQELSNECMQERRGAQHCSTDGGGI